MRTTQEVLDAIDGALDDHTVSDDAMRWTPPSDRERHADRVRHETIRRHRQQRQQGVLVPPAYAAVHAVGDMDRARVNLRAALEANPELVAQFRETLQALGAYAQDLLDAIRPVAEQVGKSYAEVANQWANAIVAASARQEPSGRARPAPTLRDTDPAAYALQLRQTRSTGPNRQLLQRQHRPRSLR